MTRLFTSIRLLGYVILLAMVGAVAYAVYISLIHYSGIAV